MAEDPHATLAGGQLDAVPGGTGRWLDAVVLGEVLVGIVGLTILLWWNSATKGKTLGAFSQAYAKGYGLFIGMIFSVSNGASMYRKSTYLLGREGTKVAAGLVTVTDQPLIPRASGMRMRVRGNALAGAA